MTDLKISGLTDGGGLVAGDALAVARAGVSYRATPIGVPVLVYRYTVTGSDKASIDTGVDTPDAGSNVWTNGDLLEVWLYARTDETATASGLACILNNDSGANYDRVRLTGQNSAASSANNNGQSSIAVTAAGASSASGVFASVELAIANYAGTVGNKTVRATMSIPNQSAAGNEIDILTFGWRSTAAVTRIAFSVVTAGKKFKVGSQLLVYKRLAS